MKPDDKITGRLQGKRAVITAAAQGIGRATAERFFAEGAEVFATDINEDCLRELSGSMRTAVVDGANARQVSEFFAATGPIDILVNCVGYVHQGTILECSYEQWQHSMRVNIDSMYHAIHAALPAMLSRQGGSIINIASIASTVKGVPRRAAYATGKAAVIGLTKSVAIDFVGAGVRCNAICPGTTQTPSLDDRINSFDNPEEARRAFIARQPMNRLGQPEEIAGMATYLASDESRFATGAVFIIDGGYAI